MLDGDPFVYFTDLLVLAVLAVPAFYLAPWAWLRQLVLGLTGSYLIFLIAPRLLAFMLIFWVGVYLLQLAATKWRDQPRSWILTAALVLLALAPMLIWKLAPSWSVTGFNLEMQQFVSWLSPWTGAVDRVRSLILPIGLSFATFRAVDQIVKVRLEILDPLKPMQQFAYGFFPTIQVIGPVSEYTEMQEQIEQRTKWNPNDTLSGLITVAVGAFKVFVLAYLLRGSQGLFGLDTHDGAPWQYWLELVMFAFYFYFNFSGFSDMAVGFGRLFGVTLAPNFNNPYLKTNPQDFWNSWHMSLTRWAQRNVFVPMGGMRAKTQYLAIVTTMMVIALWHDLSIPLVLFGLYHSAGLVLHRRWVARHPVPADRPLARRIGANLALFVFVGLSLPMLNLDLGDLPHFYERLVS